MCPKAIRLGRWPIRLQMQMQMQSGCLGKQLKQCQIFANLNPCLCLSHTHVYREGYPRSEGWVGGRASERARYALITYKIVGKQLIPFEKPPTFELWREKW